MQGMEKYCEWGVVVQIEINNYWFEKINHHPLLLSSCQMNTANTFTTTYICANADCSTVTVLKNTDALICNSCRGRILKKLRTKATISYLCR